MTLKTLRKAAMVALAAVGMGVSLCASASVILPANTTVLLKFNDFSGPIITDSGQTESGIFTITSITNTLGTNLWANSPGDFLVGYYTGLVSTAVVPDGSGGFYVPFTGGSMAVFEVSSNISPGAPTSTIGGAGGLEDQICNGACPSPWLTLNFVPGISTLFPTATELAHVTGTTTPLTGDGFGLLAVTGGSAASEFGLNASYNSNFSSCPAPVGSAYYNLCQSAGSWPLASFDPVTAVTVPEPGSLALLGIAALVGGGLARKRASKH